MTKTANNTQNNTAANQSATRDIQQAQQQQQQQQHANLHPPCCIINEKLKNLNLNDRMHSECSSTSSSNPSSSLSTPSSSILIDLNNNNSSSSSSSTNSSNQNSQFTSNSNKLNDSGIGETMSHHKNKENCIINKVNNQVEIETTNRDSIKYGELIVLGYNGQINNQHTSNMNTSTPACHQQPPLNKYPNIINNCSNSSSSCSTRRKSKFVLKSRDKPNGVKPASQHSFQSTQEADNLITKNPNHSVTYTLSRNHTVVVQYVRDEKTDMFQIGRSSESAIDFIVLDTQIPAQQNMMAQTQPLINQQITNPQSTISRFSCRIVVDREYPHTARIYAAGFDSSKRIFLGEKATKWKNENGELDGVTTNGVLIMHPVNGFTGNDSKTNEWMEVSVCGSVFSLNESRLTPNLSNTAPNTNDINNLNKSNILRDGTLIDLCGATLLWRSVDSLKSTPTKHFLHTYLENLNKLKPQCPVGLKTLVFPPINVQQSMLSGIPGKNTRYAFENRCPMVYLKCGHVHGQHDWGVKKDNERECPLCRKIGPYVQLTFGLESSIYSDLADSSTDPSLLTLNLNQYKPYAFRPCGHMATESTCKYWSRIMVPQGTAQGLSSICPFCAVPLCKEQPFVKLIFQEGSS